MATKGHPNILLRHRELAGFDDYEVYCQHGGYQALRKAVAMDTDAVIDEVKASGLRGRGGAGFPTGVKWSFIPKTEPLTYVVVNADESETGTFKDREIMEGNPHQLLEGSLICARAIRASAVYIYLRGEFWDIAGALDERIARLYAENLAGKDILGSGWDCDVFTHLGAGAYICGEERARCWRAWRASWACRACGRLSRPRKAAASISSRRWSIMWRRWPMCPGSSHRGAAAFRAIGTEQSAGTKVFCVSGNVQKPGNYELALGAPLRELLYDCAGGPPAGRQFKAVLPSGGSGPIIPTTEEILDMPLSYEGCVAAGTILGSASVIAMDDSVDMTWVASKVTKFFRHESCGKCTPCREGTYWLDKVLDRILAGEGRAQDIRLIDSVAKNMQGATLCALGDFAANPIIHTIAHFPADFQSHFAGGNGD